MKLLSRNLYLAGLVLSIIGGLMLTLVGKTQVYALIGVTIIIISLVLGAIAWVGALVKTAKLGRWGWFAFLLLLSYGTMLIYIFWGPTTLVHPPVPNTENVD